MLLAALLGAGIAVLTSGGAAHQSRSPTRALPAALVEVRAPERPVTPSALASEPAAPRATEATPVTEAASPSVSTAVVIERPPSSSKRETRVPQVIKE